MSPIRSNARLDDQAALGTNMKKLTEDEMIGLVDVETADAAAMAAQFDAVAPMNCKDESSLSQLVTEGIYSVQQITYNLRPAFLLWYSAYPGEGLWIHAAQTYHCIGASSSVCFAGILMLKQRHGCKYIRWMTIRGGLVRDAKAHGYKVEGLVMHHG